MGWVEALAWGSAVDARVTLLRSYCFGQCKNQVRSCFTYAFKTLLKMVGKPKIIMIEVGNISPPGMIESLIIWARLFSNIAWQIEELDSRIGKRPNDFFRIVRARVADNQKFPITQGLP